MWCLRNASAFAAEVVRVRAEADDRYSLPKSHDFGYSFGHRNGIPIRPTRLTPGAPHAC